MEYRIVEIGRKMESKIMLEIGKKLELGESVALITLTQTDGSSPGRKGNIMAVFQDETSLGTVGGGNLEYTLFKKGLECIKKGESEDIELDLVDAAADAADAYWPSGPGICAALIKAWQDERG